MGSAKNKKKQSSFPADFKPTATEVSSQEGDADPSNEPRSHPPVSSTLHDPNTTAIESRGKLLTSVLWAIPLPKPTEGYEATTPDDTLPLLLYTLPRSVYQKPPKDPKTLKRPHEKIIRKIRRNWQQSIQQAGDIKRGDFAHPSLFQRVRGVFLRGVSISLRFIAASDVQLLSRLPPRKKLGSIRVVYPEDPFFSSPSNPSTKSAESVSSVEGVKKNLISTLVHARRKARTRAIISGCFLPIALAAEIYAPFIFELSLIYFLVHLRGYMKANFIVKQDQKDPPADIEIGDTSSTNLPYNVFEFEAMEQETYEKIEKLLYSKCCEIDPRKFPPLEATVPELEIQAKQDTAADKMTLTRCTSDAQSLSKILMEKSSSAHTAIEFEPTGRPFEVAGVTPSEHDLESKAALSQDVSKDEIDFTQDNATAASSVTVPADESDQEGKVTKSEAGSKNELEATIDEATAPAGAPNHTPDIDPVVIKTSVPLEEITDEKNSDQAEKDDPQIGGKADSDPIELTSNPDDPSSKKATQPIKVPNVDIASSLIKSFNSRLPPDVAARHELNERRVAQDLNEIVVKVAKQHVKSVRKIKKKK